MPDSPSERWLDDFFRSYCVHRPVNATFIGIHDFDDRLPDCSENGVGDLVAGMEGLLSRARRLEGERGAGAEGGNARAGGDRGASAGKGMGHRDRMTSAGEGLPPRDRMTSPGEGMPPRDRTTSPGEGMGPRDRGAAEGGGRPPRDAAAVALDVRLASGFLRIALWEAESGHFHRGNPSFFTGEAVFGPFSLLLSDFAPLPERVESLIHRLEAVPDLLEEGRRWLGGGPGCHPAWTGRALRECQGALAFLDGGVEAVMADLVRGWREGAPGGEGARGVRDPSHLTSALRRAAATAAGAFGDFRHWLEVDGPSASEEVGCGPDILDLHLREGHFLSRRAREIAAHAREEMEATRGWLEARAGEVGASSPEEALAMLRTRHPSAEEYLARHGEIWRSCRRVAEAAELVTWPDDPPPRYLPRPRWARAAAPHLYFLFYRSPAAVDRPAEHDYLVASLPEEADEETRSAFLRTHNDAVIRANHVIHHGGLGHHVQNGYAFRAPSRIGRMAAVDCAARIALHCGGTMAEGWACYTTELMAELAEAGVEGGMTRLEAYAERAARIRMCCRAIVDVELHSGRMSLEEAADFYREKAGMPREAALGEAVKNSMFPAMALMYREGVEEIQRVRRELSTALGEGFSLRRYHDELLSWGSIPVTLAGERARAVLLREGDGEPGVPGGAPGAASSTHGTGGP